MDNNLPPSPVPDGVTLLMLRRFYDDPVYHALVHTLAGGLLDEGTAAGWSEAELRGAVLIAVEVARKTRLERGT